MLPGEPDKGTPTQQINACYGFVGDVAVYLEFQQLIVGCVEKFQFEFINVVNVKCLFVNSVVSRRVYLYDVAQLKRFYLYII
jgi:hypothetical protein